MKISVVGLGVMGVPIAENLLKAGIDLSVFNRSKQKYIPFEGRSRIAASTQEAIDNSDAALLVVPGEKEISQVLGFKDGIIQAQVAGKIIVNHATISPEYSERLAKAIIDAGGKYVEALISGSRKPAEKGELVVLAAGDEEDIHMLQPVFSAIGKETIYCGAPPSAMRMKLANNLLLIAMLEALVESFHFAKNIGLDVKQFMDLVLAGQMSNNILSVKAPKLLEGDFSQQAPIKHVAKDIQLICQEARRIGVQVPVSEVNESLFVKANENGLSEDDVIGVLKILETMG